jgi:hypothetical protein
MATEMGRHLHERGLRSRLPAIALIVSAVSVVALRAGIAAPPPPPPERDVTIEYVRVIPPGGPSQVGAVRFNDLGSHAQKAMSAQSDPEVDLYKIVRKRTFHLGVPQLVRIGPRDQIEFRRVGEGVECASVNGDIDVSTSVSPAKMPGDGSLVSFHSWNRDVYIVAWVRASLGPAPVPNLVKMRAGESILVGNPDGSAAYNVTCIQHDGVKNGGILANDFNQDYDKLYKGGANVGVSTIYECGAPGGGNGSSSE